MRRPVLNTGCARQPTWHTTAPLPDFILSLIALLYCDVLDDSLANVGLYEHIQLLTNVQLYVGFCDRVNHLKHAGIHQFQLASNWSRIFFPNAVCSSNVFPFNHYLTVIPSENNCLLEK